MKLHSPTALTVALMLAIAMSGLSHASSAPARPSQTNHPTSAVQPTARAKQHADEIKVYLDGKEIPTVSRFDGGSIAPIVVDGQLMIPVRFVKENLDSDVWVDWQWGIIQLRVGLLLKIGSKDWHARPVDFGVDGLEMTAGRLRIAPQEIRGRLYMPVDPGVFLFTGYSPVEWNSAEHTLRFTHQR
jgi:hypothetical protein